MAPLTSGNVITRNATVDAGFFADWPPGTISLTVQAAGGLAHCLKPAGGNALRAEAGQVPASAAWPAYPWQNRHGSNNQHIRTVFVCHPTGGVRVVLLVSKGGTLSRLEGKQMHKTIAVASLAALGLLVGCGTKQPERAEGGAAAGAATGAAVGLVGGPVGVVAGGVIGGVAGAATGAATKPKDVNVGAPPWQDNSRTGQKAAKQMTN